MKYAVKAKNFFSKRVLAGWLAAVGRVTLLRVNLTFHLSLDIFSSAEQVGNVILVRFKWAAVGLKNHIKCDRCVEICSDEFQRFYTPNGPNAESKNPSDLFIVHRKFEIAATSHPRWRL